MGLNAILSMDPEYPGDIATELEKHINERLDAVGAPLSEEETIFLKLYWFEMDLGSGGFSTFFYNNGHEINIILRYLKLIDAIPIIHLLEKAISVFPGGNVPENENEVVATLDKLTNDSEVDVEELWSEIDKEYNDEYEGEIFNYLIKYVRLNKDKFV